MLNALITPCTNFITGIVPQHLCKARVGGGDVTAWIEIGREQSKLGRNQTKSQTSKKDKKNFPNIEQEPETLTT